MATWGAMKTRIANEIARSDLTSEIAEAMKSAVRFYRWKYRFFLGEDVRTFYTVAGQETYTDANTSYQQLYNAGDDSMRITFGGLPEPLRKVTYAEMEALSVGTTLRGIPSHYCLYENSVRFYPTPDAAYLITWSYHRADIFNGFRTFPYSGVPPTGIDDTSPQDSAEGFWTTEAEELIRLHAKIDLFENVIRDPAEGATLKPRLAETLAMLVDVTNRRNASGVVRAEYL